MDEDFKRYYPYGELASKVLGFTGGDNQGIIGLEVKYEEYLKGENGTILTTTDARGIELEGVAEDRWSRFPAIPSRSVWITIFRLMPADGREGAGGKEGPEGGCSPDESPKRGDPCHGQCA